MADENISKVGFDATQAIQSALNLGKSLEKLSANIEKYAKALSSVEQPSAEFDKIITDISKAASQQVAASGKIVAANEKIAASNKKAVQTINDLNKALSSGGKGGGGGGKSTAAAGGEDEQRRLDNINRLIRRRFETTGSNATDLELRRFQNAREQLLALVRGTDVTSKDVAAILDNLGKKFSGFDNRVAQSLASVKKSFQGLGNEARLASDKILRDQERQAKAFNKQQQQSAAAGVGASIASAIKSPAKLDTAQFTQINKDIGRITQLVAQGKLSVNEFQQVFANVGKGINTNFTPAMRAAEQSLTSIARKATEAGTSVNGVQADFSNTERVIRRFGASLKSSLEVVKSIFVGELFFQLFGKLNSAFASSITKAAEFQVKIAEIQTIAQGSNVTFGQFSDQVRKVSDSFGLNLLDVAEAAYETLSNQVGKGTEIFGFLESSAKLATAAVSSNAAAINANSAVLNGYKLSLTETDNVAAKLFKSVDLGRFRLEEIANTIGRLTPIAKQSNVSLDELLGALATITIQGVPVDEAMTQIKNVLIQLAKPTKELTELFQSMGFVNVEAALKTKGFVGTLEILDKTINGSTSSTLKNVDEIRAALGVLNLTGANLNQLSANIDAISNSTEGFNNAVNIVANNSGKKLQIELEKIKNFFTVDIGQGVLKATQVVSGAFGGLANGVKILTSAVGLGAAAWASYAIFVRRAIVATAISQFQTLQTAIIGVSASVITRLIPSLALATTQTTLLNAALAVNPIFAAVAVGAGLGAALAGLSAFTDRAAEAARLLETIKQTQDKISADSLTKQKKVLADESKSLKDELDKRSKSVNEYYAALLTAANNSANESGKLAEKSTKTLQEILRRGVDANKSAIADATRNVSKLKSDIEEANRIAANFSRTQGDAAFDRATAAAANNPRQLNRIQNRRISDLGADAARFQQQGNLQQTVKTFQDIDKILNDQFQNQIRLNQEMGRSPSFGLATIERQIVSLQNEQLAVVNKIGQEKQRQLDLALQEEKRLKDSSRDFQENFRKLFDFQKNFQTEKGVNPKTKEEFDSAIAEFEKLQNAVRAGIPNIRFDDQISAATAAETAISNIRQNLFDKFNQNRIKADAESALQFENKFTQALDRLSVARNKNAENLANPKNQLTQQIQFLQQAFEGGIKDRSFSQLFQAAGNTGLSAEIRQSFKTALDAVASEDIPKLNDSVGKLFDQLNRAKGFSRLPELQAGAQANGDAETNSKLELSNLLSQLDTINKLIEARKRLDEQQSSLKGKLGEIVPRTNANDLVTPAGVDKFDRLFNSLNSVEIKQKEVQAAFDAITLEPKVNTEGLNKLNDVLKEIVTSATDAKNALNGLPGGASPDANRYYGGTIQRFANGGRAIGFDKINALLSPHETVINAKDSRRFFSQISAFNAGNGMRNFSSGGTVTNVGDINVSVTGGSTSDGTVRAIASKLQREIRKGTIKFGG